MNFDQYKFDTRWFKDMTPEEVDSFKAQLVNQKNILDKLCKIVYNIVRSDGDVRISDYETPSWSHKQAHRNGRKDAFESVLSLANISKTSDDYE